MSKKDPEVYIRHILDCLNDIERYTKGLSKDDFFDNKLVQDAVIRNLEIVGEASKQITDDVRKRFPHLEWKKMAGLRDVLIHNYLGVDLNEVWLIVAERVSKLKSDLKEILKSFKE